MSKLIIVILLLKAYCYAQQNPAEPKKNFIYGQYQYDTKIDVVINNETEQILDFYENTDIWEGYPTRVHVSTNDSVPLDHPVFITATQQKGISSWELPMVVQTGNSAILFNEMGRTLCPHDAGPDIKTENRPTVHITTQNPSNTSVAIKLRRVKDFYVEVNKEVELKVTPSTPKYYYFSFDQNPGNVSRGRLRMPSFNYTIPKSVILIINSSDELCATVSIQNNSCPVFDNEKEIMYQGYHLTMTSKGGITLTQSMFPLGFYVVFVVKESDAECTGASETANAPAVSGDVRMKSFKFVVVATVSYREYLIGALVVVALVLLIAAFVMLVAVPFQQIREEVIIEEPVPSTSRVEDAPAADDTAPLVGEDAPENAEESWSAALTVARHTRAPPDTRARRSERYFWGALTVAVVYALPVVQLLYTYQQMVFETGNQDLCYYNFLCAHPLGRLSDFNHVYSNIAYVMLGLSFAIQVRRRQLRQGARQNVGIPPHVGLQYSMALALCMEGCLSACYHLCPNKMNFQFDSSFMYVIAVLVMLKLYQNRHSDLIPSAHSTFMLIALIMSIGLFGILFPSVYFSVFFTTLHLLTCLVLTLKIYYAGSFKMDRSLPRRAWSHIRSRGLATLAPAHAARAALLAAANLANCSFAVYSAFTFMSIIPSLLIHNKDFARQLLAILLGNAILYTWFYVCMKLVHGERLRAHAWLYLAAAHAAWLAALTQFVNGNTRWSETPAMSRRHNAQCTSLSLFDSHDVWHVASAAALFLSFNLLLTVDDDREGVRREEIATF